MLYVVKQIQEIDHKITKNKGKSSNTSTQAQTLLQVLAEEHGMTASKNGEQYQAKIAKAPERSSPKKRHKTDCS